MKVLIIRPQPGADATARRFKGAGYAPVLMPMFAIEHLPPPSVSIDGYDAILLTSGNAARAACGFLESARDTPISTFLRDFAAIEGENRTVTIAGRVMSRRGQGGIIFAEFLLRRRLVVVREVAQEEKGQHVVAEVVRVHRPAQLVGDAPEGFAQLFLVLVVHFFGRRLILFSRAFSSASSCWSAFFAS